jgi:hypothetical protein
MSQLTEIFLNLQRKVQLGSVHISGRKVQLYFFNRKVQLKQVFVGASPAARRKRTLSDRLCLP